MPRLLPRRHLRHSQLSLAVFLVLFSLFLPTPHATNFSISITETVTEPSYFRLSPNTEDVVFGLAPRGYLSAFLAVTYSPSSPNTDPPEAFPALVICQASLSFVRTPSFERKHAVETMPNVYNEAATLHCKPSKQPERVGPCRSLSLKTDNEPSEYTFTAGQNDDQLKPNELYVVAIVACENAVVKGVGHKLTVQGNVQWLNPENSFPHLGWEEATFPYIAKAALILFAIPCILMLIYACIARIARFTLPFTLLVSVSVAAALEALHAGLTFLYFRRVAHTGLRERWYLYTRLSVVAFADVAFVCVAMVIATGYHMFPTNWFVDGCRPVFSLYIGVALQILIVITVKLLFPFRSLGVLTYTLAAGVIAYIMCLSSYRNYHFLRRYAVLIHQSHIAVKSTPIPGMQLFFRINIAVTAFIYLFKIISVGVWDYGSKRPDALWGSLAIADATMLLWYTFVLFPWKKSALYVELSNISNERLHQAQTWRAAHAENENGRANVEARTQQERARQDVRGNESHESVPDSGSGNDRNTQEAMEEGRNDGRIDQAVEPVPPWVVWRSGMSLPRPNAGTWDVYVHATGIRRREGRLVPVLPASIVIGSPSDSPDTLNLTIGTPVTGPNSVPKVFDEKGVEVAEHLLSSRGRRDASSSAGFAISSPLNARGTGPESASERRIGLQSVLGRLRPGNRTTQTGSVIQHPPHTPDVEHPSLELSDAPSVNLSQTEDSELGLHAASSRMSNDGVILGREDR